ncbi:MAG TPA: argininosuccinate lyase, partial [Paenibacillaceae bacterium]|nr:argininosuccinate lyase [Paenibacillaceae bacterium]
VQEDFSNATDLADYLVNKGMPFRQAHEVVGKTVLYCIEQNKFLLDLSLEEYKQFSELFEEDIYVALDPQQVVNARDCFGGTASNRVAEQIAIAEELLKANHTWVDAHIEKIQLDLL